MQFHVLGPLEVTHDGRTVAVGGARTRAVLAMLLIDATSFQVLYAEDAGQPWHPASVTKLMTAYLAFASIKAGRVTLDTPVTISQHAWNQEPAKSGLAVGQRVVVPRL